MKSTSSDISFCTKSARWRNCFFRRLRVFEPFAGAMSIPIPTQDAATFAGQVAWFVYGFGYASVIASVALMIYLFKKSGSSGPFDT